MLSSLLSEIKISARRKRDTNLLGKQNTISLLYSFRPGLHNNIIQIFSCFNSHKLKENRTIKYTLEEVKNRDLHISTLTVTYNYADIATLRRKNQNRSILEVYMTKKKKDVSTTLITNQPDGRDVKIKMQNTFSTHESLYSTMNGFRNLEISSIYKCHKKHIRIILNHINRQFHNKQCGQHKLS